MVGFARICLFFIFLLFAAVFVASSKFRPASSVVALGAGIICNKIPGLAPRQRNICRSRPDVVVSVGEGVKIAAEECAFQFRNSRWNCTGVGDITRVLFKDRLAGSKEAAYAYAINSAGIAYAVTRACAQGNLTSCGCDLHKAEGHDLRSGWKWGGCSADVHYGVIFARRFVDAKEVHEDIKSLVNLHNNRAGRKVLKKSMGTECKCHGTSGACTMKTCWTRLPSFRAIGHNLKSKYMKARLVQPIKGVRARRPLFLKLKRAKRQHRKPRRGELVFLYNSPNYCEFDARNGSPGTSGRQCNKTDSGPSGCGLLCCGRGYHAQEYTRKWKCNCKFHWCCSVTCDTCRERTQKYTCK